MKIIIEHRFTKREIKGGFNLCGSRDDLTVLKEAVEKTLLDENFSYGWVKVSDVTLSPVDNSMTIIEQASIAHTAPIEWE